MVTLLQRQNRHASCVASSISRSSIVYQCQRFAAFGDLVAQAITCQLPHVCDFYQPLLLQANWRWGYWVPDMTVRCYSSWHLGFSIGLGVPLLLLVFVAIPFLPVFLLFKYRKRLFATSVKLRLGFIYKSYRYVTHTYVKVTHTHFQTQAIMR